MQTWVPDIIYALIYFVAFFLYHGLNLSLFAFFPILSSDFPSKLDLISCFLSLILKLSLILIVHAWYDELGKPLSPHANCLTREEAGQTVNPKDSQFSLKKERWWKSMNRKRVVVKSRNKLKTVHFDINLRDIYNRTKVFWRYIFIRFYVNNEITGKSFHWDWVVRQCHP